MPDETKTFAGPAVGGLAPLPANENELPPSSGEEQKLPPVNEEFLPEPEEDEKPLAPLAPLSNEIVKPQLATMSNQHGAIRDIPVGGVSLDEIAQATKKLLDAQEKVPFVIPLDPGEAPGAYRAVIINGYRFEIKKNVMVYLPMAVANLLMNAYNVENTALSNHPSNLNSANADTKRALGI